MKTLDEVIEQLIDCHTNWARWSQTSDIVDRSAVEDALHYLKEYQTILPLVPSLINTALEVQKKGKTIG